MVVFWRRRKALPSKHLSRWKRFEDFLETSWRCLSSSFSENFFKTSSRRLDKDEYIALSHTLQKTSSKFPKMIKRPQDVWPRLLQDVLQNRLQDIFKTFCSNVFKRSSKRLQYVLHWCLHHHVNLPRSHFRTQSLQER